VDVRQGFEELQGVHVALIELFAAEGRVSGQGLDESA
jgi:hypothetical protein